MSNNNITLQTLIVIHQHPRVLLGMKKRGFGAGRWNGFGGKVLETETIEDAAKRELWEEARITTHVIEKLGIIDFQFQGKLGIIQVHIFRSDTFSGVPKETEEMLPEWFHIDDIPLDKMWPDDSYWLPYFLSRKKFKGKFLFGESDRILEKELIEVDEL